MKVHCETCQVLQLEKGIPLYVITAKQAKTREIVGNQIEEGSIDEGSKDIVVNRQVGAVG